jgi:hypothetical protein
VSVPQHQPSRKGNLINFQELQFAATVRAEAKALRTNAHHAYYNRVKTQYDEPSRQQQMQQWEAEHPVSHYVPQALAEIRNVAAQIKSLP